MTTRMTSTHCTSTIAWRFTTWTPTSTSTESEHECAHCHTSSLIIHTHWLKNESLAFHSHPYPWPSTWLSLFDSTLSALYFVTFLLSVFLSFFFLFYLELFPEFLYTKDMENLRHSAANESEDTYDVFNSPTENDVKFEICEQNTLTRHIFSCLSALMIMSHTTLAQVLVRVIPSMCHAPVCLISLRPSLRTLHLSLSSSDSSS